MTFAEIIEKHPDAANILFNSDFTALDVEWQCMKPLNRDVWLME